METEEIPQGFVHSRLIDNLNENGMTLLQLGSVWEAGLDSRGGQLYLFFQTYKSLIDGAQWRRWC